MPITTCVFLGSHQSLQECTLSAAVSPTNEHEIRWVGAFHQPQVAEVLDPKVYDPHSFSHLPNHRIAELAAFHFFRAFHLPCEIVGYGLGVDGAVHALEDEVGGFDPAEVTQHHFAAE